MLISFSKIYAQELIQKIDSVCFSISEAKQINSKLIELERLQELDIENEVERLQKDLELAQRIIDNQNQQIELYKSSLELSEQKFELEKNNKRTKRFVVAGFVGYGVNENSQVGGNVSIGIGYKFFEF